MLSQSPACLGDAGDVEIYRDKIPLTEPFYTSGKLVKTGTPGNKDFLIKLAIICPSRGISLYPPQAAPTAERVLRLVLSK